MAHVRHNPLALVDPKLSVVIPVYNEKATLEEILRRVTDTEPRKEIILVDDCSTDGSRQILEKMVQLQNSGESDLKRPPSKKSSAASPTPNLAKRLFSWTTALPTAPARSLKKWSSCKTPANLRHPLSTALIPSTSATSASFSNRKIRERGRPCAAALRKLPATSSSSRMLTSNTIRAITTNFSNPSSMAVLMRSEERRVGKEGRSRWS